MLNKIIKFLVIVLILFPAYIHAQDLLGDSASFGNNVKFAGSVSSGNVYLKTNCGSIIIGANDRCKTITATNFVALGALDIGSISFPENTFQNVIYLLTTNYNNFYLSNTTATNQIGSYYYNPFISFESSVLADPNLINPQTGQPFNGKISINLSSKKVFRTIVPNGMDVTEETYVTTLTNGINKKFLMDNYGLSQATVDNIFFKKITIRLNVSGSSNVIIDGRVNYSIRFFGN